jgi:hypothetical protein
MSCFIDQSLPDQNFLDLIKLITFHYFSWMRLMQADDGENWMNELHPGATCLTCCCHLIAEDPKESDCLAQSEICGL